jgi:hypothetical protein
MNVPLELNTDYVIFSPILAQQINSVGVPIQGCSSWYDTSQLNSVQCSAFVGMTCTDNSPFLGVVGLSDALSIQILLGQDSGSVPNNGVYYANIDNTTPAYGLSVMDGSYFCASNNQITISPAFFHLSYDFSTTITSSGVGLNICSSNEGGSSPDTIWNTGANTCTLSTTIENEGWLIIPVYRQNPSDNLVRLGDVVRFYNASWQSYLGVGDNSWGNSILNDNLLNLSTTLPAQNQKLLVLYGSPPSSGPDFTLFQFLPTGGLLPLSYNPFQQSPPLSTTCPCPITQCPSTLCNTGTLMYIDPVGGQGCPVICQFDVANTTCSFQIDPAVCSLCKKSQCGNCADGEMCARDLNSGNCSCVSILKTTQEIQNKNFWLYIIVALMLTVFIVGGGYMAWVYFSDKYSNKVNQILKQPKQSSSIDSAIGQVFGIESK